MDAIRVLVVDDSALFRRYLSKALQNLPDVELVGTACDGAEALRKIRSERPDLVTLDVEMPGLDGIATLRGIQAQRLDTKVLMLSALGGERLTVEALCLGAMDFIVKPRGMHGHTQLCDLLARKVRQFRKGASPETLDLATKEGRRTPCVRLVVVAVSTGGPNALAEILPTLLPGFPVPIVLVQHMPRVFTTILAERLASKCRLPVLEAQEGMILRPGHIYIAPGDQHLSLYGNVLEPRVCLTGQAQENGCRPAADVLFRSAAEIFKDGCLGIVLTGMGRDGLDGVRHIVKAGGYVLAQDQETSVVWGMPRLVAEAGLADEVLPLHSFARRLSDLVSR